VPTRKPLELPPLEYDFGHCIIEAVKVGPRRELTFTVAILEWHGHRGQYAHTVEVRFGGIENFDEVATFFADPPYDVMDIRYSLEKLSKPGRLVFVMPCQREPGWLEVRCSSLQVRGPRS
jgi:hypothetical protein